MKTSKNSRKGFRMRISGQEGGLLLVTWHYLNFYEKVFMS